MKTLLSMALGAFIVFLTACQANEIPEPLPLPPTVIPFPGIIDITDEAVVELSPPLVFTSNWDTPSNSIGADFDLDQDSINDISIIYYGQPTRIGWTSTFSVYSLSPELTIYAYHTIDTILIYELIETQYTTIVARNTNIHDYPENASNIRYRHPERTLVKRMAQGDTIPLVGTVAADYINHNGITLYHKSNDSSPTAHGSSTYSYQYGEFPFHESGFLLFRWNRPDNDRIGWLQLSVQHSSIHLKRYAIYDLEN